MIRAPRRVTLRDMNSDTLRADLDRTRLQHRSRRLQLVLTVLRERADVQARHGEVAPPLQQAIAGFGNELASVREQLLRIDDARRRT